MSNVSKGTKEHEHSQTKWSQKVDYEPQVNIQRNHSINWLVDPSLYMIDSCSCLLVGLVLFF